MRNNNTRVPGYATYPAKEAEDCACWALPVLAFVPVQQLNNVFEPEHGFGKGTIFPELEKPWKGGCCQ